MSRTITVALLTLLLAPAAAQTPPAPAAAPLVFPEGLPDWAFKTNPPDWFPQEHPPAPRVVAGPAPNACGSCHLMSDQGHPESADVAGLPVEYFIRQMNDFKTGARRGVNRAYPHPPRPIRFLTSQT